MTFTETLKQIRLKCLDCTCQQVEEVNKCTIVKCPLWELRFGKNPTPSRKGNGKALNEYRFKTSNLNLKQAL